MKTNHLLVSGVHISEDQYSYSGSFILSVNGHTMQVSLPEMEMDSKLSEIKTFFGLEDPLDEIRRVVMSMVMTNAAVSSHISEGEGYQEGKRKKKTDKSADSLDMA